MGNCPRFKACVHEPAVELRGYKELLRSLVYGNHFSKRVDYDDDDDDKIHFCGGNVHLITTEKSWDEKISEANKDGKIVVANFSASWCGPCRQIAPFYSELSEKFPFLMFLMVDVDELSDFSASWDIRATPTFFFLKNEQQINKLVGANKPELEKKIVLHADTMP